jgi:hypothetical protein
MNRDKIYPYLTPPGYPPVPNLTEALGHEISVNFVEDLGNIVSGIVTARLDGSLTIPQIRDLARKNLDRQLLDGGVELTAYEGPDARTFIVTSGHWLSAATLLWTGLYELASENLKSVKILASIPHRDALLVFPEGIFEYRTLMRDFVKQHESDGRKPLTWELFRITPGGVTAFVEND